MAAKEFSDLKNLARKAVLEEKIAGLSGNMRGTELAKILDAAQKEIKTNVAQGYLTSLTGIIDSLEEVPPQHWAGGAKIISELLSLASQDPFLKDSIAGKKDLGTFRQIGKELIREVERQSEYTTRAKKALANSAKRLYRGALDKGADYRSYGGRIARTFAFGIRAISKTTRAIHRRSERKAESEKRLGSARATGLKAVESGRRQGQQLDEFAAERSDDSPAQTKTADSTAATVVKVDELINVVKQTKTEGGESKFTNNPQWVGTQEEESNSPIVVHLKDIHAAITYQTAQTLELAAMKDADEKYAAEAAAEQAEATGVGETNRLLNLILGKEGGFGVASSGGRGGGGGGIGGKGGILGKLTGVLGSLGTGIGKFIGGLGGGIIAGFMKGVGAGALAAPKFIIAMAGLGAGLGIFFIEMAGTAKIIQMFGGGEAIQSLLTNVSVGLTAFNTIDGLNLLAVGPGMVALGAGLAAITAGEIITGLGGFLTLGDPLGDTAKSLKAYNDVDGGNLLAVGGGMGALAVGLGALTAVKLVSGIGNFISSAVGTVKGWFGADKADKKPSVIGFVKEFEDLDGTKLEENADSISKLGRGLIFMAAGLNKFNTVTPEQMQNVFDLTDRIQGLGRPTPAGGLGGIPTDSDVRAGSGARSTGTGRVTSRSQRQSEGRRRTGLRTKGGSDGQAHAGGPSHPGVFALARQIQGNVPGFNRFTGFNDRYHKNKRSKHAEGLAMDFTLEGGIDDGPQAADTVQRLAAASGVRGSDLYVQDEYTKPSPGSTGGHVHVQFKNRDAAAKMDNGGAAVGGPSGNEHTPMQSDTSSMMMAVGGPSPTRDAGTFRAASNRQAAQPVSVTSVSAPNIAPVVNVVSGGGGGPAIVPMPIRTEPVENTLLAITRMNFV